MRASLGTKKNIVFYWEKRKGIPRISLTAKELSH